jgi:hypothetical protein
MTSYKRVNPLATVYPARVIQSCEELPWRARTKSDLKSSILIVPALMWAAQSTGSPSTQKNATTPFVNSRPLPMI